MSLARNLIRTIKFQDRPTHVNISVACSYLASCFDMSDESLHRLISAALLRYTVAAIIISDLWKNVLESDQKYKDCQEVARSMYR